ncbi:hypothetical protein [Aquimarina muelleri]|uniref:Uncharacterized protein n=1 Tax=Aquimarina muelleri TaxID=279356 RepID=A0A918N3P8_9FLAO|nr:hypothetical protein [Aquimarina muelleri]MCX2764052.1 hypothetical protein [Aquimarina muelleri]GGX28242.1 hypothetical protein GCM10007384_31950 [Aquimarina muelleri]
MKAFLIAIIASIGFASYGQENSLNSVAIEWEELSAPLSIEKNESEIHKYELLEVNLSVDLRRQSLRKNYTMFIDTPKYKDVSSVYKIKPSTSKSSGFTISGNGSNLNTNTGRLKNTAYKDAGIYLHNYSNPYTRHRRNHGTSMFIY